MKIEIEITQLLVRTKQTLAVAESCTGGLVSHRITNVPGSSQFFKGGMIAYSNEIKCRLLGVPPKTLKQFGAASAPVAQAMAKQVRKKYKTDFGIGLTGIAGPTGGTKEKPVGLVYLAACSSQKTICLKCIFKGSRLAVKKQASTQALKLLRKII